MRSWELVRQSLESVTRSRLRSALTVLGIAIGSGALVSMVAFVLGLQSQIELPMKALGLLNNIEVRPRAFEDAEAPAGAPGKTPPPLDDAAVERFQAIRGVEYAYPDFRLTGIRVSRGQTSRSAFAVGLPREASLIGVFGDLLVAGNYFSFEPLPEAIAGEKLLRDLGYGEPRDAVGQTLMLDAEGLDAATADQFTLRRERLAIRVVGVYRPPGFAANLAANGLLLPVDLMRHLPGSVVERNLHRLRNGGGSALLGFPGVTVHARRAADVPEIERQIRAMGFDTRTVLSRMQEARRFFVFLEVLLAAVGTVGLIVAGLGIMNTLLMTVMERTQEIGIYKAIGASDGDIRVLFLTEAAALGVAGGLGGLALARAVCWVLQWGIHQYAAYRGVEGPVEAFRFPAWLLAGAVAYAVAISVFSGLYPASRAARIDPIKALRGP